MFTLGKARLIHNVCADVVSPQKGRHFEPLTEVSRLVGHDVHVTSPRTPKPKRALLSEQVLHRNRLIRSQSNEDLL